jgi:LuxR family maltose regulon positive regulatory protein
MRIKLEQGDDEGARRMIEGIDQRAMTDRSPIIQSRHAAYHLDLAVAQGHLDEASRWGEELVQYGDILPFYLRHLLVPLLIADSRKEHVSEQLWKFYETVQVEWLSPEWQGWRIRTRLYQALAASEPDEALGFLAEALVAAEPEGWTRTFVDEGAALAPLLRRAASRGIAQEYATRLLVLIESEERVRAETKGRRSRPVYGLLTEREAEVLGLLAAGLSNRQIAERLFISLGTAKAHVHNISEKLNVTGRTKVIARARELHLI